MNTLSAFIRKRARVKRWLKGKKEDMTVDVLFTNFASLMLDEPVFIRVALMPSNEMVVTMEPLADDNTYSVYEPFTNLDQAKHLSTKLSLVERLVKMRQAHLLLSEVKGVNDDGRCPKEFK